MSAPPEYIRGSRLLGHPARRGSDLNPHEGRAYPRTSRAPASIDLLIWSIPFERKKKHVVNISILYSDPAFKKIRQCVCVLLRFNDFVKYKCPCVSTYQILSFKLMYYQHLKCAHLCALQKYQSLYSECD